MNELLALVQNGWADIAAVGICALIGYFVNKNLQDNYHTKDEIKEIMENSILKHEKDCSNNCELKEMVKEIFSQIKQINEKLYDLVQK